MALKDRIQRLKTLVRRKLRGGGEEWRDLWDNASCGYHSLDPNGVFLRMNQTELSWLGYTREEVIGKLSFFDLLAPERREETRRRFAAFKESGSVKELEFDLIRKDGTVLPVLLTSVAVRDARGNYLYSRSTVFDVSIHRRLQAELRQAHDNLEAQVEERTADLAKANLELKMTVAAQRRTEAMLRGREVQLHRSEENLRRLTAYLNKVREEERTRISREIHDELGQQLTAIKMDLCWIQAKLVRVEPEGEAGNFRQRLAEAVQLVDATIANVRKIATDLRPGILDDLGLPAAMEWQAQEFERRSGIACCFSCRVKDLPLDSEQTTGVFRIFQEVLTNVARHSGASRTDVRLDTDGEGLILEVCDNGRGIAEEERALSKSLGLLGMRERAKLLGGAFEIEGHPGEGTRVALRVPLAAQTKNANENARRWDIYCEY